MGQNFSDISQDPSICVIQQSQTTTTRSTTRKIEKNVARGSDSSNKNPNWPSSRRGSPSKKRAKSQSSTAVVAFCSAVLIMCSLWPAQRRATRCPSWLPQTRSRAQRRSTAQRNAAQRSLNPSESAGLTPAAPLRVCGQRSATHCTVRRCCRDLLSEAPLIPL